MKTRFVRAALAACPLLALACAAPAADEELVGSQEAASTTSTPRLAHLPDVRGLRIGGCVPNQVPGCWLESDDGANPLARAKKLYDDYFKPRRPASAAEFGWAPAPWADTLIATARLPILPKGLSVGEYQSWMALSPVTPRFTRDERRRNVAVFRELAADDELQASKPAALTVPYERYNAFDYIPAGLTHYQWPSAASDIMATNLVYRVLRQPYLMERALAACTADESVPCIDAVASITEVDIGSALDVRFLRFDGEGRAQVSRMFRVVVVDSGHAIQSQATEGPGKSGPYLRVNTGGDQRLLWRGEIGGSLSQLLETGPGATGALLKYSRANGRGTPDLPPPGACTDLNLNHWKCATDDDGVERTLKCQDFAWKTFTFGCKIPAGALLEPQSP